MLSNSEKNALIAAFSYDHCCLQICSSSLVLSQLNPLGARVSFSLEDTDWSSHILGSKKKKVEIVVFKMGLQQFKFKYLSNPAVLQG